MAGYGKTNYRNRNTRNNRTRSNRKVAVPKTKKPTRNYVKSNAKAINALSRSIYKLKMSQYGRVQQNFQRSTNIVKPTAAFPVLFDSTDLTCFRSKAGQIFQQGCQFWQYNVAGTLGTPSGFNVQDSFGNPFWENQNRDIIDGGCYFPTYIKYTFEISGRPSLDNTRIRLDFFSAKPGTHIQGTTTNDIIRLPTALNHLNNIADPTKNRINPIFFKKYITKSIFINSSKTDAATKGTTANIKRVSVILKPKKPRYQADTSPETYNDEDMPSADFPTGSYGPYNVPAEAPLWCLISTDDLITTLGDEVNVTVSRMCRWRDTIGSALLS